MPTTDKQALDNLIAKLRAQSISTWRIAYNATKDEHYLSYTKHTSSQNSRKLYELAQKCGYTDQDIAQLLGSNQPTTTFPDKIIDIMTKLTVDDKLEPSVIIHNINTPLPFDTCWGITYNMIYGYVLAHNNKDHILDQLYALACKLQHKDKNRQNALAISELFYQLRSVFEDSGKAIDMYHHFEQLVKHRPDIHEMILNAIQTPKN